jgi:hypothetical protein
MSVHRLIPLSLLVLAAASTGYGTSAEPKADAAKRKVVEGGAADKKADEGKAPADGYVKVRVEVELRGVLSCSDEAVTISTDKEHKWVLDFGEDKETRAKAKRLDGKTVLVKGSAILRGIKTETPDTPENTYLKERGKPPKTIPVLDLEPKVAVKSLVAAAKD